jgi:mannan endo-1,4-beta-mannosidase
MAKSIWSLIILLILISCSNDKSKPTSANNVSRTNTILADSLATEETVALFTNLKTFASDKFLFGHQETTAYGVGWVNDGFGNKSDVKEVCGDFPAVYGWDIGDVGQDKNLDGVPFFQIKALIKDAYERGGINTVSFHQDNPVTGNHAWDNTPAVSKILQGGSHHEKYLQNLDRVSAFMKDLKTDDGTYIPVVFRPYHEHNQTWPWWGVEACSEEEFIELWRMTVEYLINDQDIHHLLFAISPQDIKTESQYFERYPGDDCVDILGYDYWRSSYSADYVSHLNEAMDVLGKAASDRGKIPVLTEIGMDQLAIPNWWTDYLLKGLNHSVHSRKIAWALVWRNDSVEHFHAPYPGQVSAANFVAFYNDPRTVFESDLPDMYK